MKDDSTIRGTETLTGQFDEAARLRLTVDAARYQAYLDGSDMTPEQKEEFIRALWSVIIAFVDLGFGVHPVSQACGQTPETESPGGKDGPDVVGFRDTDP